MKPENYNTQTCPHCGTENQSSASAWTGIINEGETIRCSGCNRPVEYRNGMVHSGSNKKETKKFNIIFFASSAVMLGLMLYLNRLFDIVSFKRDWALK